MCPLTHHQGTGNATSAHMTRATMMLAQPGIGAVAAKTRAITMMPAQPAGAVAHMTTVDDNYTDTSNAAKAASFPPGATILKVSGPDGQQRLPGDVFSDRRNPADRRRQ